VPPPRIIDDDALDHLHFRRPSRPVLIARWLSRQCSSTSRRVCPLARSRVGAGADRGAGPVYALDWCKTPVLGSHGRPTVRLVAGSLTDDFRNQLAILGPRDERVLVEDDADGAAELVVLAEAAHGYPATSVQWQPAVPGAGWSAQSELLASTGDLLRVWSFAPDQAAMGGSGYVGRQAPAPPYSLTTKNTLQGVRCTSNKH
jgi:WD repeat-containing protein 68